MSLTPIAPAPIAVFASTHPVTANPTTSTVINSATDRAATNRANAQHSTGPRTPEGKEQMRFNALRHGLYAETVVLPHEDQSAYESLMDRLLAAYDPQTEEEHTLLLTLQDTEWRLGRVVSLESGILAIGTERHVGLIREKFDSANDITCKALAQAAGYIENARYLDQLSRHEHRLRRLHDRTARDLVALIAKRTAPFQPVGSVPSISKSAQVPPPKSTHASIPVAAPAAAKTTSTVPKFSGPLRKQHRKQWLRDQAKKNAATL